MLLEDNISGNNQTKTDDYIVLKIKKILEKNNKKGLRSSIIALHHFTDEQLKQMQLSEAYRPKETYFKGSTRYRDMATIIMLINRPGEYADLSSEYKMMEEEFKYLFIVDIPKNRDGETGLVRFLSKIEYITYKEL